MKQAELGQRPRMHRKDTQGVTEWINDAETCVGSASRSDGKKAGRTPCVIEWSNATDTHIGGASVGDAKKAGSIHSLGSRQCYETEEEKLNFVRESFQLDSKAILNKDEKLKEEVI